VATTPTRLMTFAEFEQLPDPRGGVHLELHHGEVIEVAPPKHGHKQRQRKLRMLMEGPAVGAGIVETEVGYRPAPDHEYWVADVAFVSQTHWNSVPRNGYLERPPELVIEVLSPSNTAKEIREKKKLCLENGSREFWAVDEAYRQVEVFTPDGRTIIYRTGQQIPLFFAPGVSLRVDDIFA
jgi:Uma2 family endonuclease